MQLLKYFYIILISMISFHAFAITPAKLSEDQKIVLKNIETLYDTHNIVKSRFIQTDNLGNKANGWFIIEKPGKSRIEYTDLPIRLIANDTSLMIQDTKEKQKSFIPLLNSPFSYLLNEKISFFSEKVIIEKFQEYDDFIEITLRSQENQALGSITLIITKTGEIIKWQIEDAKGVITEVYLVAAEFKKGSITNLGIFNIHKIINIDYKDIKIQEDKNNPTEENQDISKNKIPQEENNKNKVNVNTNNASSLNQEQSPLKTNNPPLETNNLAKDQNK